MIMSTIQYTSNIDEYTQDDDYEYDASYDDVFDTKHVAQILDDIHVTTTDSTYNHNYKQFFNDQYHGFNQIAQLSVDIDGVSTVMVITMNFKMQCKANQIIQYTCLV